MKLPLSLIKSFIHLDLEPSAIAETLTLLGIEVDRIANESPSFEGVVVGEVVSAARHPNAEKLQIAQVSDGVHTIPVVCAASNCRAGMKTALAKPGALLIGSDGKERKIEKCTLRGVESCGVLCSEEELGIPHRGEGIIELPQEMKAGQDLTPVLWDPIFELSLTPNLGHCMSALGVARELSAALQKPIHRSKVTLKENEKSELDKKLKVAIPDSQICPLYLCRLIEGVQIGPSPFWLQRHLIACGLNPICNAVDIANYILLKVGQPLHVFDYDKIEGRILRVGTSDATQKFLGLDGIERDVPAGTLLISDARRPIAIAGILGGENSATTHQTKNILIEAAVFDPAAIRKGAKNLDLRTESAQRFEKGIDPNGVKTALDEACALILELCGGRLAKGTIEFNKQPFAPKEIRCRSDRVNQILGTRLSLTEIEEIFQRLGFTSQETEKGSLRVNVPLFRSDISEEIDLIEEVARIYGYNNIEKNAARFASSQIPHDPAYLFEIEVRKRLIALGLQEFLTSDLISPKLAGLAQEWVHPDVRLLTALRPKTEEYSILRPSLLPGLMQTAAGNFGFRNQTLSAFEIGRIHFLQKNQLVEQPMAALMLAGKIAPAHWSGKPADADFFDLKGLLENLLEGLRIPSYSFQPGQHPSFHPGRQANLHCNGLLVGSFGEIHPAFLAKLDIKQRLFYAELNLHHLMGLQKQQARMHPLPKFPASERDWTIPLPIQLPIQTVFSAIQSVRSPLLEKVELIDLYVPETGDQKNASFRFTYRDPFKTISFEEVEEQHAKLVEKVRSILNLAEDLT